MFNVKVSRFPQWRIPSDLISMTKHDFMILFFFVGMIGVYFVGHILEATKAWSHVYFTISLVSFLGTFVFAMLGSGKKIEN